MNEKLIIIGGSAGSLQTMLEILTTLRPNYPFPILLVMHRHVSNDSILEELLSMKSGLIAREIEEKEPINPGHIYISPADYHVLIENNESFSLDMSEKIHFSRPSLDVVFRSAADVFGSRVVAFVLSGANADGAQGLSYIKQKGGMVVVQEPLDAMVAYMPEQAIKAVKPDYILNAPGIAELLNSLVVSH
jgi:two-component system chemotaxis response regulator CheB